MSLQTVRTIILITGWPTLIIGSVVIVYRAWQFNRDLKKSVFGRLALLMSMGWFVSMYSLGVVATIFMLKSPRLGVPVVLPIFLVWVGTMVLISIVVYRLRKEAVRLMGMYLGLGEEVEKQTKEINKEKAELVAAKKLAEDKAQELNKINRLMVGRELRIADLKKKLKNKSAR
ncbi:hypothetical protein ACFL0Y_04310 [Patescibacteria group bacterium]